MERIGALSSLDEAVDSLVPTELQRLAESIISEASFVQGVAAALPGSAVRVLGAVGDALQKSAMGFRQLADVITKDPGLVDAIKKLWTRTGQKAADLKTMLIGLGRNTIQNFLAYLYVNSVPHPENVDLSQHVLGKYESVGRTSRKVLDTLTEDMVDKIMAFEGGEMETEEEVVEFFQELLDTGLIHSLQGSYQRTAQQMLDAGYITMPEKKPKGPDTPPSPSPEQFESNGGIMKGFIKNVIEETVKAKDRKKSVAEAVTKILEGRGEGMGVGGPRQGDGGADACYCPECDKSFPKQKGVPCQTGKCPTCGGKLVGKNA